MAENHCPNCNKLLTYLSMNKGRPVVIKYECQTCGTKALAKIALDYQVEWAYKGVPSNG